MTDDDLGPKLERMESVFLESTPWTDYDLDDMPVLSAAVAALPAPFLDALKYLHQHPDNVECWRCGALIGWALDGEPERLTWLPTGLVRLVVEGCRTDARAMCEGCTPYVDAMSYQAMVRRQREMAAGFVQHFNPTGAQDG